MLKLSTYLPSLEDHDDIPSPLMDDDAIPAVVAPIAAINETPVLPVDDIGHLPRIEEIVELPPHLDPTPLAPLEGEVIQEEIIAENLDTEAGQLLTAQVAMEDYVKLLRHSGKNMTRQSAAFMAVGMRRANRLIPGVSLGLEDENSGTQVMAMQKAEVNEKGIGAKIKEVASKIWEWLKNKAKQFAEWLRNLRSNNEKTKADVVYLIAATKAVETGNPAAVKSLEAPQGIKVAQVLDAIHGEDVRAPKPGKMVKLPAKFVPFLTRNGKLDLNLSVENKVRSEMVVEFLKDATGFLNDLGGYFKSITDKTSTEEISDTVSDMLRKNLGGKAGKWELHGMTVERTADGILSVNKTDADADVEVQIPSPQEIRQYLQDVEKVLDAEVSEFQPIGEAYEKAQASMIAAGDEIDGRVSHETAEAIAAAIGKVVKGHAIEDRLREVSQHLDQTSTIAAKACDFFLTNILGKGNTISQEDFERLPSKGLSVISQPAGPGAMARAGAAVKAAWEKLKAWFRAKWEQLTSWVSRLWERLFGTKQKTEILLLMNEYVPENPGQAPSGPPPALPPGTGLKSVTVVRSIAGPSSQEAPVVEVAPEPVVAGPAIPKGHVQLPELARLQLASGYAFEPSIEETYITWFNNTYLPAMVKMWHDVTSMTTSTFDVNAFDAWGNKLTSMADKVMAGAPYGELPGGSTLIENPGSVCFSFGGRGKDNVTGSVKALSKRQVNQILSRQNKAIVGMTQAKQEIVKLDALRAQFESTIDRLATSSDAQTASAYRAYYDAVNRLMSTNAITQIGSTFTRSFDARVMVMDAMIAARTKA